MSCAKTAIGSATSSARTICLRLGFALRLSLRRGPRFRLGLRQRGGLALLLAPLRLGGVGFVLGAKRGLRSREFTLTTFIFRLRPPGGGQFFPLGGLLRGGLRRQFLSLSLGEDFLRARGGFGGLLGSGRLLRQRLLGPRRFQASPFLSLGQQARSLGRVGFAAFFVLGRHGCGVEAPDLRHAAIRHGHLQIRPAVTDFIADHDSAERASELGRRLFPLVAHFQGERGEGKREGGEEVTREAGTDTHRRKLPAQIHVRKPSLSAVRSNRFQKPGTVRLLPLSLRPSSKRKGAATLAQAEGFG